MPSNVTANFSLFLLSNISTPAKGNSTRDNFVNGPVKKTASTGNDIVKTQKKFELRNTHKLLLKRKIEKKQPPRHYESARHTHREKNPPPRRVVKGTLRENKHPANRSAHLPANHQLPSIPAGIGKNNKTEARHAAVKATTPDLKDNIKRLDEFAANASSLPEPLRTLANDSGKMACRTEVVCKAMAREGIEPSDHGSRHPTSAKTQSSHSRQKRGWFGVDEEKLAAEMGPYVQNITAVLAGKLQRGLVTIESMVENATNHVITTTDGFADRVDNVENMVRNATQHVMTTTDGFSGQVADIELMVKNATLHVMTTTNGFSDRAEGIEGMVRNATQYVIRSIDGFSDDALAMKTMVKNATEDTQETSSYVKKVIEESEENLKLYIYFSGAFILATGLICLLTAGCCHCRRSRHSLELTIDKRKVADDQRFLLELGHQLITRPASGNPVDYKISRNSNRYTIEINSSDIVIQAMLKDAFKDVQEKESPSEISPMMDSDLSLPASPETQQTSGRKKSRKMRNPDSIKLQTKVTIIPNGTASGNKETSF